LKNKRKFVAYGKIQGTNITFEIYRWAYSEGQFRHLVFKALKKMYPKVSFTKGSLVHTNCPANQYLPYEVADITDKNNNEVRRIVSRMKIPVA